MSLEAGTRIREKLSEAVEYAIRELANGFLRYPANEELRKKAAAGALDAGDFYRQLLWLIYRLLFLLVTEDRNLIFPGRVEKTQKKQREIYYSYYTRHDLVNQLLKSALDPLVEEKLRGPAHPEIDWEPNKNDGCPLPPFKWDEDRRSLLRAELDAWCALLYGLERDELRYILDPQELHGEDFPGETFRVLKEKEIRKYGEYRTHPLVLEAYDRFRPSWDMESHLEKLKTIWDECQKDLSQPSKPERTIITQTRQVAEPGTGYGGLFDGENG